ncbi:ExbD/TolR family protein [candidate division KSB1 bacterium]
MLLNKRPKAANDIPTSSMADIAFLLLVFFLVTTTINTDKGIGMILPQLGDQKEIPKKNIVNIHVNAAGQVMVADEEVPIRSIMDNIQRRLEENPILIVSIKVAKETEYDIFIEVLDQIKLSGATRISIAEID